MTGAEALVLVAAAVAATRVTRFVTTDTLTSPARAALARRYADKRSLSGPYWIVELVHCDWCVSVWVAAVAVLALCAMGLLHWRLVVLAWLAVAGGAGLLLDAVRP